MRRALTIPLLCGILLVVALQASARGQTSQPMAPAYAQWKNGPSTASDYFPIAVWLQTPANAAAYKRIGINLYIGLWKGPTEAQLAALEKAGMPVICDQNALALQHLDRKIIVGWMHGDEPDNAQAIPGKPGYGPPITPEQIKADHERMRQADPDRPVMLNLGQGVAWDGWIGRGTRTNKPEDYPHYAQGGDILSFDIYPAAAADKAVAGKLWLVPFGVDRLRKWSDDRKPVWTCIETTRISNPSATVTPRQVTAEVWMSLIHGSRGIIYFAHEFKPKFVEAALLADREMAVAVGQVNAQIQALAPVLNSPTIKDGASVRSSAPDVPVDILVKHYGRGGDGATYILAVAMREGGRGKTQATFTVPGRKGPASVAVLGEDRTIAVQDGRWEDAFGAYGVHLYRLADPR